MPDPSNHLFEVSVQITDLQDAPGKTLDDRFDGHRLRFSLPVWTPGSYLVREYARHVQDVQALGQTQPLTIEKITKNSWEVIVPPNQAAVTVTYRVLATELTVRTNHLDQTHGYFNPAALLMMVEGWQNHPHYVTIVPAYFHWRVATPLPLVTGTTHTYQAHTYDELVDSPFEVGEHQRFEFTVADKPHSVVIWGKGNYDLRTLSEHITQIIETEANLFGGLPYDRYLFLIHLTHTGYGGLEHRNSCSLICPRMAFRNADSYQTVINLITHEFFHLWNVKRLRPKALETFDYHQENYTPSLWFSEGTTSYYDLYLPQRANLYSAETFLKLLSKDITRFLKTPGRLVQPLREASFDAWIKLYRRDSHSDNHQISYYLKGSLVTFLLDLLIRKEHQNQRSFDQVLQQLWQTFGVVEKGFEEADLEKTIVDILCRPIPEFFANYLDGITELPFNEYLFPFGLELVAQPSPLPYWGMAFRDQGRVMISSVASGSPAQKAGLEPEDELVAIEGMRVTAEQATNLPAYYEPGEKVTVTVFHQDLLVTRTVEFAPPQPDSFKIQPLTDPTPDQKRLYEGWLGEPHPAA